MATFQIHGSGVSQRIAIGAAAIIPRGQINVSRRALRADEVDAEQARYSQALATARSRLVAIGEDIPADSPAGVRAFIDTQLLMMADATLSAAPQAIIARQLCNAEWALKQQHNLLLRAFASIDDPYLKTRRDDISHVINRVQRALLPESSLIDMIGGIKDFDRHIAIIDDLGPAELISLHKRGIAGFITEYGGPLSHTAILARSLDIPALVGASGAGRLIAGGETVVIDGGRNIVLCAPDRLLRRWYRDKIRDYKNRQRALAAIRDKKAVSLNGETVALQANIELPEDLRLARQSGCVGIGLYRTEFMFMDGDRPPDEEAQYRAYRKVVLRMRGMPVTIRTLDLGVDKQIDGGRGDGPLSVNPALGLRAVRLCLQDHALFHTQLRAILRAAHGADVRLMIPMVSAVREIRQVKAHIASAQAALRRRRARFADTVPVGAMIEVPAAAINADGFARHCDFLSIGTNDLIQYTLAIDRMDDSVNYLYDPLHPAVLRLIKSTIDAARRADIPVSMCGEMAGDTRYTRLLLGLGLREFSMQASAILQVKEVVANTDIEAIGALATGIMNADDSDAAQDCLRRMNLIAA